MRILGLHTIALMFGLLIAACTSIPQLAQKPSDQERAEPTLEVRTNTHLRLLTEHTSTEHTSTEQISKATHPSLEASDVPATGQRKP
jgi:starvation-inducible outer membrane lipoprotein